MALCHWLQLALTDGIGPILARRLIETCGGVEAACAADTRTLQQIEGIGSHKSGNILASLRAAAGEVDAELERAAAAGAAVICPDDEVYPALLNSIPDPPLVLYVKGQLEPRDLNAVAIVGSRKCSFYGREQGERFAALLAGAGVTVISGGARGIDSASHRGALSHPHGRTIAVQGCGVNIAYPPENAPLFEQIASRGAVVSEYPIDSPPVPENFPRRNRIVSGMSRGVLVIEADERSGALITARQACDDHGRPVFALPGRVDNRMSAGPHMLIRDGATLVTKLEDILDSLGPLPQQVMESMPESLKEEVLTPPAQPSPREAPAGIDLELLSEGQRQIIAHLDGEPVSVDQIIERSGLDASAVMRELTFLSLKGVVRRVG
ncbi:MAG TPA: DNA-processing protein DprA, partial [Tepidisphaeraceae bacterium]|nr:DNA-processing protein DprA [Tepidisphaeraceae bacterium]